MFEGTHIVRLMKMCRLLGAGKGLTLQQVRSKLKTSRRTSFRDLKSLQQLGVPVELTEHCYRVRLKIGDCRKRICDYQIQALNKLLDSSMR